MKGEIVSLKTAKAIMKLQEKNKELQQRIDKAIEYIKIDLSQGGERELRDLVDGYELLNILEGKDEF